MTTATKQLDFDEAPPRYAVAAVVHHPEDQDRFLAVKRPPGDEELPDVWGLPAVTLRSGELPVEGLRRIGRTKLATELEPVRFVGAKAADRGEYALILMDIEARVAGQKPSVSEVHPEGTRYVDQTWTEDQRVLREAAQQGSLCSQILLEAGGIEY